MTGVKAGPADYGRHARRVESMLIDQQLEPLLLRWALAIARGVDRLDPWPDGQAGGEFARRAGIAQGRAVSGPPRHGGGHIESNWQLKRAVERDVRRYEPFASGYRWDNPCDAPMIRRAGTCGQRSSISGVWTNLDTGEGVLRAACSRHRDWYYRELRTHQALLKERIVPRPFANAGGRLVSHMPEINWTPVYAWASPQPDWTWPPERLAPTTKPTLSLLIGDKGVAPTPRQQPTPPPERLRALVEGRRHLEPVTT